MSLVRINDHGRIKELRESDFELLHINHENPVKIYSGSQAHRHSFYELFLFSTQGEVHEIDFKKFPVNPYSVHFVSPAQVHRLKDGNAKTTLFCFNENFISRYDKKKIGEVYPFYSLHAHHPVLNLSKTDFESVMYFAEGIEIEFRSGSPYRYEIIANLMTAMMAKLKEKYLQANPDTNENNSVLSPHLYQFLALLEKNYLQHMGVSGFSDQLNISPNYLNAICKKELGTSAIQLIQQRLMLEAKRLLYATDLSIKEVASELNFEDPAYFNRLFKKNLKQTPLDFRTSSRK